VVGELCDWSYHKLLVVHNSDGKLVADLAAVEFVDGMSYDAQHKRLYLAGDQFVDVFEQRDRDYYVPLAKIPGSFRAKTGILAPELNRYFLAVPHDENNEAEVRTYEIQP
jgi:hypothetical protein